MTTPDTAWWFEAHAAHQLLIQRCSDCSQLRHPPAPMCAECLSVEWDTVEASGRGAVHSFVVCHHPKMPGFDPPYVVAVVELSEGTRVLSNVVACAPDEVHIGMPLDVEFVDLDDRQSYPQFRPAWSATPSGRDEL